MTRDSNDTEVETRLASLQRERRSRGLWSLAVAVILAMLTVGVYVAVRYADTARDAATESRSVVSEQDGRLKNLEKALDAQRTQFVLCKDRGSDVKGCEEPIAPSPGDIGPQGIQGLQGVQGIEGEDGARGRPGANGTNGRNGTDGRDGTDGQDGRSITGPPGADGADGSDGATGQPGAQGPVGPTGAQGERGPAGSDGASAFPFSFVFSVLDTIGGETTYTVACQMAGCTVSQS